MPAWTVYSPQHDRYSAIMSTCKDLEKWGRRASDPGAMTSANHSRDLLLETAIAQEQVDVLFQPLIEPVSGKIVGAEALARSCVAPDAQQLFDRAAAGGLNERLSRLVQHKALRLAASWDGPLKGLGVSINVLPHDLSRDGFDSWLLDEIDDAGIDPKRVMVEITESALLVDQPAVATRLHRLREAGLRVAVDD